MGKQIEAEKETVADAALRLLLDEINPAHAEQVRRGIRTIEESTVDGAAVLRAICNALHYAAPTPDPAAELYDSVDWLAQGYPSAGAEIEDMANVGRALMERIADATKSGAQLAGWSPADCPTEIVTDLLNMLHEATPTADLPALIEAITTRRRPPYAADATGFNAGLDAAVAIVTARLAVARPVGAGVGELVAELRTMGDQCSKMEAATAFGGAGTSVRVKDAPYLIDLLVRAASALDRTREAGEVETPKRGDKIKWTRSLEDRPLAVRDLEYVTVASWGLPGMPLVCTLQEVAGTFPMGWFDRTREPQVDALQEENARLREALQQIAGGVVAFDAHPVGVIETWRSIARAALGEKSDG